jgi:hypothetical protein
MTKSNAWILYQLVSDSPMSHTEFLRQVTSSLLFSSNSDIVASSSDSRVLEPPKAKRGHRAVVPCEARFTGTQHLPKKMEKRLRCARCSKLSFFQCTGCSTATDNILALHPECFIAYHTK